MCIPPGEPINNYTFVIAVGNKEQPYILLLHIYLRVTAFELSLYQYVTFTVFRVLPFFKDDYPLFSFECSGLNHISRFDWPILCH